MEQSKAKKADGPKMLTEGGNKSTRSMTAAMEKSNTDSTQSAEQWIKDRMVEAFQWKE